VSNPYPREYASFEPDKETLRRVAAAAGGEIDPATVATVFDPRGERVEYQKDLWDRFLIAAIGVFLLDLLLRRVRIFDRKFVAKPRRLAAP
jgi:hypothetical protein